MPNINERAQKNASDSTRLHAAWAGDKRKAYAAANTRAAPRSLASAAAAGAATRAPGPAAASRDLADGDGSLAGMKAMTRDQWAGAGANGKLNDDDELRDSVHAPMQIHEVRSCDVRDGRHAFR